MKHWRIFLAIFIVLALFSLAIVATWSSSMAKMKKEAESLAKANEHKVEKGNIVLKVVETGSLEPVKVVEVKSRVGGRVARLLVEEGDIVEKGQLIAVIDPQETELQVQQNRAQVKGAKSGIQQLDANLAQRRVTITSQIERSKIRLRELDLELEAQPKLTTAAIASAESTLATAKKDRDVLVKVTLPNAVTQSQKAVQDAQNNLSKAKIDHQRYKDLYEKGYVSRRDWEQAELQMQLSETQLSQAREANQRLAEEHRLQREQADQRVLQAEADLTRAKTNAFVDKAKKEEYARAQQDLKDARAALHEIDSLLAQRRSSEATVEQLQSVLDDSLRQLSETEVRAPIGGVISKKSVQVGELVNALSTFSAGTPLVKIEDRSTMLVKLQINEIDVARLHEEMAAEISIDALAGKKFSGLVTKIAPAMIESVTGADPVVKYEVEVTMDNVPREAKSGMSAKCEMTAVNVQDVVRIPLEFLGKDTDGDYVMIKDEKAKAVKPKTASPGQKPTAPGKRTSVVIGKKSSSHVEIKSGIDTGAILVRPEYKGPDRKGMMDFGSDEE
ncbi:efflux RND transporter periplasmic adaptor subunit [Kamptonema cortianum]|nr:efflux RND transporter periplasmic adaptor subunit [Geitlerinema splendidum]MDK3158510.1 efflux RND transporter periplasmic adaptor subunit [Kamptonema cortianum]